VPFTFAVGEDIIQQKRMKRLKKREGEKSFWDPTRKRDIEPWRPTPREEWIGFRETANLHQMQTRVKAFNEFVARLWSRTKRKTRVPYIDLYAARPDNPHRDRYMLCKDCTRDWDFMIREPQANCSCSTLLELDMCAPFSRDNTVTLACEMVQHIREDHWVDTDAYGKFMWVKDKVKPRTAFPFQVCAVCRATTLDDCKRFLTCNVCQGVHYCSEECMVSDRQRHKAWCHRPEEREEHGVRKQLKKMRSEIWDQHKKWKIKDAVRHRIAWLPALQRQNKNLLDSPEAIRLTLPGFERTRKVLPVGREYDALTKKDEGSRALVPVPAVVKLTRAPMSRREEIPDQYALNEMGMTEEEWVQVNRQTWDESERLDQEEFALAEKLAQEQPSMEELPEVAEAAKSETVRFLQANTMLDSVRLNDKFVARLEAMDKPKAPKERPPWEKVDFEEQQTYYNSALSRQMSRKNAYGVPAAGTGSRPINQETGVVLEESAVEMKARKGGLRLSPEAIARMEAARELARDKNPKKKGMNKSEKAQYVQPSRKHIEDFRPQGEWWD